MEDQNLAKAEGSSPNLMSFESPLKPNLLQPERIVAEKSSPFLMVKTDTVSTISPDLDNITPIAASTPFTTNHAPKFKFPSPYPILEEVHDPFDFVEKKINQMANDPFEMVAAEAAKVSPNIEINFGNSENEKTDSLNKAFCEVTGDDKTNSSNDKTVDASATSSVKTAITGETNATVTSEEKDDDDEGLNDISPPWDGTGDSDSQSDLEEDLVNVLRNASMELMSFSSSPGEPLTEDHIRGLELKYCEPLQSVLDESAPLDLEVPPLSLDTSVFSSPILETSMLVQMETIDNTTFELPPVNDSLIETCRGKDTKTIKSKLLTPRIGVKPLGVITNSPAVTTLSKLPPRLASRLLQPKVYHNKENK